MRYLFLITIFCCTWQYSIAQSNAGIDTSLKFNQRFTKCELKWVVMPRKDTSSNYFYGFIYLDEQAGFTFDLKGSFIIDKEGHYNGDTSISKNRMLKYRLGPNTTNVALLPSQHFSELHTQARPKWVDIYYTGIDTASVYHNYRMGFNFNAAGDSETALTYLNKAHSLDPHYKGVEFEMAYAYNALNQPEKAIAILETAVKNDPSNVLLYKELGFAYSHNKMYDKAITYFKQGIDISPGIQNANKAEMAFNLANVYKSTGNDTEFKNWMTKAKDWALPNSDLYKYLVSKGY
jgi:tetratricopeptide (TPR) repeat protein